MVNEMPGWDRRSRPRLRNQPRSRRKAHSSKGARYDPFGNLTGQDQPWYFRHIGKILVAFWSFIAIVVVALVVLAYHVWW